MEVGGLPTGSEKRLLVREMFDRIAPRYDAMNRLMTAGLDQRWRRRALAAVGVGRGDRVLDLACGTGDLATFASDLGADVVGVDFSGIMLKCAQRRRVPASLVRGDAASLPLADASVSVATCGFALRNFVSLPEVFRELARVLAPEGRIALIEVDRPNVGLVRAAHSVYFDRIVPLIGSIISDRAAYHYLPESTAYLPPPAELRRAAARGRDPRRVAYAFGCIARRCGGRAPREWARLCARRSRVARARGNSPAVEYETHACRARLSAPR
jgi:demethylmenaquinone methyltransferase/2-methoxy-6-polyprenyl-1,4-benzoquinol methylase